MVRTCLVLAQIGVLTAAVGAQQSQSSMTDAVKAGRKTFQARCAMCHVGQDPATEMANAPARQRSTFGPLLSNTQASDEAALREKIKNGGPRMPGYALALTNEQIEQVVAFIKTLDRPLTKLAVARPGE